MAPDRLGFLIHSPELLNHYGCVMDLLPPGSFDLVLCGDAEADPTLPALAQRWQAGLVLAEEVIRSGTRPSAPSWPMPGARGTRCSASAGASS